MTPAALPEADAQGVRRRPGFLNVPRTLGAAGTRADSARAQIRSRQVLKASSGRIFRSPNADRHDLSRVQRPTAGYQIAGSWRPEPDS